ncbi:hypothetical protein BU16DRAFT_338903 [Lophium mytilinum]|uniref:Uncharacterized protein n=1 Tax=Lophium mytilinum TaxID=390894 RepID=A0A6A6QWV1_9PEZI|nr:hypothetical protein BU16DRAFT_338903 [Lophium mytilinum]
MLSDISLIPIAGILELRPTALSPRRRPDAVPLPPVTSLRTAYLLSPLAIYVLPIYFACGSCGYVLGCCERLRRRIGAGECESRFFQSWGFDSMAFVKMKPRYCGTPIHSPLLYL